MYLHYLLMLLYVYVLLLHLKMIKEEICNNLWRITHTHVYGNTRSPNKMGAKFYLKYVILVVWSSSERWLDHKQVNKCVWPNFFSMPICQHFPSSKFALYNTR